MAHRLVRGFRGASRNLVFQHQSKRIDNVHKISTRNYVNEMRKSAFEGNILRLIRNEIQYELEISPPYQPPPEYNAFKVDEKPGEQYIRLLRKFGDTEEIKVEVTMFDGSIPVKKGADDADYDVKLHMTFIVDVFKGDDSDVLEFICSAWPDSVEIRKVFTRQRHQTKYEPYMGPAFKELDDELQNSLYDFLEARGVDDKLAVFLHHYMMNKDKIECVRWMEKLKSFVQKE